MEQSIEIVKMLKAMADENRLNILKQLQEGSCCACELLDSLKISQPTLSHHMKLLHDAKLVQAKKEGRWMHYELDQNHFDQLKTFLDELTPKEGN